MSPPARPNLLILMADQLAAAALPAYGGTVARAPHIGRLAREGVVFDAAYCSSPLCAPSRYGMLTGRLPSRFGAFDNASELPSEVPTFAHHLRLAGYRTVLSGKMHFAGPNQLHGFEERLTTDIYPADFAWTPDWRRPGVRPSWYHDMASVLEAGPCVRTNQLDFDDEVVFQARRKLHDLARDGDARPFCLVVSMTHPHDPYAISAPHWARYSDDEIDLPRLGASDVPDDPHSRRLRAACLIDATPLTTAQVRRARHAYYGAISYVDDQVGVLLETLREIDRADDTVVVLLSDHGDMLGERGLWYKMNFFEPAARVPLVFHAPGRFAPGRVREAVALHDLLPTFVELAGAGAPPEGIDGRSLLAQLARHGGGRDEAACEYLGEGAVAPMAMLRRGRFKFIHCAADPELLFDLEADPLELRNLAAAPAHAALVAELRAEVARRWPLQALHERVLASQDARRLVHAAESQGRRSAWDFEPRKDPSRQYVRSHMPLASIEAMSRYPAPPRADSSSAPTP